VKDGGREGRGGKHWPQSSPQFQNPKTATDQCHTASGASALQKCFLNAVIVIVVKQSKTSFKEAMKCFVLVILNIGTYMNLY